MKRYEELKNNNLNISISHRNCTIEKFSRYYEKIARLFFKQRYLR